MKEFFKRITALSLFAAMIFGLVGGIPITKTSAANTDLNGNEIINLLDGKNPSFEEVSVPNWTISDHVSQTEEDAYAGGTWSLKLTDENTKTSQWALSESVSIDASKNYTATVQVKNTTKAVMTVLFYDADGAEMTDKAIAVEAAASNGEWQEMKAQLTIPAGASKLAMKLSTTDAETGIAFFDAVAVYAEAVELVDPDLINGDFEGAWSGMLPSGWSTVGFGMPIYTPFDRDGGKALMVIPDMFGGYHFASNSFDVQGGVYYNLTADVKVVTSATKGCTIRIDFYDADNKVIAIEKDPLVATKKNPNVLVLKGDYSADWMTVALNVQSPANAVTARISIEDSALTAGVCYFDNIDVSVSRNLPVDSFEGPINDKNVPVTWVCHANLAVNTTSDYVRSGSQSLEVTSGLVVYGPTIQVDYGESYEASIYAKRKPGFEDASLNMDGNCQVVIYFYKANGARRLAAFTNVTSVSTEWNKLTASGIAQDGEVYAQIAFYYTKGAGTVCFDDPSLVQTTDNNLHPSVLPNSGFETRSVVNKSPYAQWNGDATDHCASEYVGGDRGFVAHDTHTSNSHAQIWTDTIPVTPGEQYSLTVKAKGTGSLQAYMIYYNKADADYMKDRLKNDKGGLLCNWTNVTLDPNEWTSVVVSGAVIPENVTYVRVALVSVKDKEKNVTDVYIDDVVFFKGVARLEVNGSNGVLPNANFEILAEDGTFENWSRVNNKVATVIDAKKDPANVFDGRYALKLTVPEDMKGSHGVQSKPFPVEEGKTYKLSLYIKDGAGYGHQGWDSYISYYDNNKERIGVKWVTSGATGEWNYIEISGTAPEGTIYAQVQLVSGAAKGTAYFDKLKFEEIETPENNPLDPVYLDIDWEIADDRHPRLFFDTEGLEDIKLFTNSHANTAYGYRGEDVYAELLQVADGYLAMTTWENEQTKNDMKFTLVYPLYPVFEDPTNRDDHAFLPDGTPTNSPYLTKFGQTMLVHAKTLSLAYILSGDVKYGERAVQYMMDMCDWDQWANLHSKNNETMESNQEMGYFVEMVAYTYDMCYDLLTDAQRDKVCRAMIDKGLIPLYEDLPGYMRRYNDMDWGIMMVVGACAILNEDNLEEVKPYLDMGMTYVNYRYNHFQYSGDNEGHMYDALAVDDLTRAVMMLERTCGYSTAWEHPFLTETVEDLILGFFDPVNGHYSSYSDCPPNTSFYPMTAAILSQRGNDLATYYISMSGVLESSFDKLVFHTRQAREDLKEPAANLGNVTYVKPQGYGSLRTGWGALDSILTIYANDSAKDHNHYEQNSIQLAFSGIWSLADTGYKDMSLSDQTFYQTKYANTTIYVDRRPQVLLGKGSLAPVFDTSLYGYLIGSAPEAYGLQDKQNVLNKFDRHTIMVNHDNYPYYIIIDDLESNVEREFGWNFHTLGWDRLEVDGNQIVYDQDTLITGEDIDGNPVSGNRITICRFGNTIHSTFVGNTKLSVNKFGYQGYGPTLLVEGESAKSYQFMNVLSMQRGTGSQVSINFEKMMENALDYRNEVYNPDGISWSTRKEGGSLNSARSVSIGTSLVMFRAGLVGDWMTFPFDVEKEGEYEVQIEMGSSWAYYGTWNVYLDGELITEYEDNGTICLLYVDAGKRFMSAGRHEVKIELASTPDNAMTGTIVSCGGVILDDGSSAGEGDIRVLESYDTEDVLGASIAYGKLLTDLVLFNRGTGTVTAGDLTTDGQQASALGLYEGNVNEGYAVTKGTSLKYGDQVLMSADGPVSVAVDFSLANYPIKNNDSEEDPVLLDDFNFDIPVVQVSASADAAQTVTLFVGTDAPYSVKVDGVATDSTYADGMVTFTLPAGTHDVTFTGNHHCVFDQHNVALPNMMSRATCTESAVYFVSCVCGSNGTETFTYGEPLGHRMVEVPGVEPTNETDGNIAHWKCTTCKKLFADANGTQELTTDDVFLMNLSAKTMLIVGLCVGGGILVIAAVVIVILAKRGVFKKKENNPEEATSEEPVAETTE